MPDKKELSKYLIQKTLNAHKHLNFVDRIINKNKYPTLDLGEGRSATHKMSYATNDSGAVVYPNVVYDSQSGALKELSPYDAYKHAMDLREYIPFDSESDAKWFSENYKLVWE